MYVAWGNSSPADETNYFSEHYVISIRESPSDRWHRVPLVFGHITHAALTSA
jgi:hypothetical protein